MILLPVHIDVVDRLIPIWVPLVAKIAEKSRESVEDLIGHVRAGRVLVVLAWNEETREAHALLGVEATKRGNDLIARLIWLIGHKPVKHGEWKALYSRLEAFLHDQGYAGVQAVTHPKWTALLARNGLKHTHSLFEKDF